MYCCCLCDFCCLCRTISPLWDTKDGLFVGMTHWWPVWSESKDLDVVWVIDIGFAILFLFWVLFFFALTYWDPSGANNPAIFDHGSKYEDLTGYSEKSKFGALMSKNGNTCALGLLIWFPKHEKEDRIVCLMNLWSTPLKVYLVFSSVFPPEVISLLLNPNPNPNPILYAWHNNYISFLHSFILVSGWWWVLPVSGCWLPPPALRHSPTPAAVG